MKNLNDLRIIVRNIISERFEGGIDKGMFQAISDKSPRSSFSSNEKGKEGNSFYPFGSSISNVPEYEKIQKKVILKIKEKVPNIEADEDFKKMNEKYFELFKTFKSSGNKPTQLNDFLINTINPFFKKNQGLLSIPEVKSFYGIK